MNGYKLCLEQVVKELIPKKSSAESAISCEFSENKQSTSPKKISYNQKVKQSLICELLEFIRSHDFTSLLNSMISKQIPEILVDIILLRSADLIPDSVLHLAYLF